MAAPDTSLILVIDVGNSGAKLGAVVGDKVAGPLRLPRVDARAVNDMAKPMLQGREAIVAISGSDPQKIKGLAWELRKLRLGTCVNVGPDHPGIPEALVDEPLQAGVDRRIQVLAAAELAGEAVAVVSCGSAVTVDIGDDEGRLLGGAILPGLDMGSRALASGTAKLPVVDLAGATGMPGKSTEIAIRNGLLIGAAGAVSRLLSDAGVEDSVPLYLTGQDAPHLAEHLKRPTRAQPGLGILGVALAVRAAPPAKRDV